MSTKGKSGQEAALSLVDKKKYLYTRSDPSPVVELRSSSTAWSTTGGASHVNKQQHYRHDIEQQILRNAQFRKSRENYLNEQLAQIRNYQSHLDQVDRKESENPIDKSNPFRI